MVLMSPSNGTEKACAHYVLQDISHGYFPANFYGFLITGAVFDFVVCPSNILLNTLVIAALKTKRRLQTHANILLGCLALTDLMVGLFVLPVHTTMTIFLLQGKDYGDFCVLNLVLIISLTICCVSSLYQLTLVSAERYLAIKHTFTHSTVLTKTRLLVFSALAWIAAVLPLSFQGLSPMIITLIYVLVVTSISLICWFQVVVYVEARRHEKAILSQQVSNEAKQKFLKDKKALKLTTTILVALVLSYCPSFISRVVVQVFATEETSTDSRSLTRFLIVLPVMFNSVLNPVIYAVRKRQFRVAFVELLLRKSYEEAKDVEKRLFGKSNNTTTRSRENAVERIEDGVQGEDKQAENPNT